MSAIALITTTIHVPRALEGYARDARAHGRAIKIYVAGDRRTPAETMDYCGGLARETGVECEYLDPPAQEAFLAPWPGLREHLPWNCIQRRNVALLKAYRDGADVLVTVDDDNFVAEDDYFSHVSSHIGSSHSSHTGIGASPTLPAYGRAGEWFNVCRFLATANNYQFVPRGYGMAARAGLPDGGAPVRGAPLTLPVAVVAGFWLGDPDIDAATRLAHPVEVTRYRLDHNFFLAPGARCPFNSQNTALARATLPAYFLSPHVGRHDDIFASFVVKRIADHLGWGVSFGRPLVRQQRNEHDLLRDFDLERVGMRYVDSFTEALDGVTLHGDSFADCALEICERLGPSGTDRESDANGSWRDALGAFFAGYRLWAGSSVWH